MENKLYLILYASYGHVAYQPHHHLFIDSIYHALISVIGSYKEDKPIGVVHDHVGAYGAGNLPKLRKGLGYQIPETLGCTTKTKKPYASSLWIHDPNAHRVCPSTLHGWCYEKHYMSGRLCILLVSWVLCELLINPEVIASWVKISFFEKKERKLREHEAFFTVDGINFLTKIQLSRSNIWFTCLIEPI